MMTVSTPPSHIKPVWQLFPNAQQLAQQAAKDILQAAEKAIAKHGAFHIVLAGGTTPKAIYKLLSQASSDWQHWHIYLGDERCLPMNHPERNSVMIQQCLLHAVPILTTNIHFIPAEQGPIAAAAAYQETIKPMTRFDMVLLGMGEDGHTASLFPGDVHNQTQLVHPVLHSPKPPAERVSLSSGCLSNNEQILILITGESKHLRIVDWISGINMPVTAITSCHQASVYCDKAAWAGNT